MKMTQAKLNELSQAMYKVLYKDDKPNYNLSTRDFMQLLFVMDDLSANPILKVK